MRGWPEEMWGSRRVRYADAPPVTHHATFEVDDAVLDKAGLTRASLADEIGERRWYHNFDFGDGVVTPGREAQDAKLTALELPDVTGKTVIDIGAYDGYYSFECEKQGAARVVASDHWSWTWPGEDARRNFDLVHSILDSKVEPLLCPVEQLNGEEHGTFDLTLFLGVLYHAPDMLGYLRAVRSVTSGMLVLETLVDGLEIDRPAAIFYPPGAIPGDDSNHWGPNPACVEEMLLKVGFSRVERRSLWLRNQLADLGAKKPSKHLADGRMIFHAWV